MTKFQSVLQRFLKGFVAGGLAQVVLILGPGVNVHNLEDIKALATSLAFGFIVGGLLAVEKLINWQP